MADGGKYTAEVTYNGAVGTCSFNLVVNPVAPIDIIDIDGDSPLYVLEGDCKELKVNLVLLFHEKLLVGTFHYLNILICNVSLVTC